jgi:hypothetical protein
VKFYNPLKAAQTLGSMNVFALQQRQCAVMRSFANTPINLWSQIAEHRINRIPRYRSSKKRRRLAEFRASGMAKPALINLAGFVV